MSLLPRDTFPTRWWVDREPQYEQQIVVNWLYQEVDEHKIKQMPILHEIKGWRRREVIAYFSTFDWTARMYQ